MRKVGITSQSFPKRPLRGREWNIVKTYEKRDLGKETRNIRFEIIHGDEQLAMKLKESEIQKEYISEYTWYNECTKLGRYCIYCTRKTTTYWKLQPNLKVGNFFFEKILFCGLNTGHNEMMELKPKNEI